MFDSFFSDAVTFVPILLQGVVTTIYVTLLALVLSTVLGLFWALLRVCGVSVCVRGCVCYVYVCCVYV